jgi:hypothetical protein
MNNIGQFTNYDNLPIEDGFFVITFPSPAFKLGFCGDVLSIGKTIYLKLDGELKPFEIGKTGMFEFQPETFRDENAGAPEVDIIITCPEVRIPADLKFTLDYCWEVF